MVLFRKIKRGNREIIMNLNLVMLESLVKLSSQILVQENDFVRAGVPLSDGAITPEDILRIKGPAVQQLVNEFKKYTVYKG
jgi:DNA-directed RNA polymerase subunit beta'